MTQKKVVDERIVHEVGQVYRIAYYLFNAGLLIDLFLKLYSGSVPAGFEAFRYIGLEVIVVIGVNLAALVMLWRKGMMDDEARYAESDIFPWKHYLLECVIGGSAVGLLACLFKYLGGQFAGVTAWVYVILFLSITLCTILFTMLFLYLSYRVAKRRRAQMYDSDDAQ